MSVAASNDLRVGLMESAAAEWGMILSLVFGGCCWNVFALEAVLKSDPNSGIFLTFIQFLFVTVQTLSSQLYFLPTSLLPRFKKRKVPLRRWFVQVGLFLGVSLMNNWAFGFKIPVPIHIIFRSGGLCVSMATGYFFAKRRYTLSQVTSVILITLGITLATLSAPPKPSSASASPTNPAGSRNAVIGSTDVLSDAFQYVLGIGLLAAALVVSAFMGLWQEETYRAYGKEWREGLFYTHALSLPFFLPLSSSFPTHITRFSSTPPLRLSNLLPSLANLQHLLGFHPLPNKFPGESSRFDWADIAIPAAWAALGANVITQGLCIRGVNRLTARVSAVSVNLILTIRKAVSLGISVWYYGSGFNIGLILGAGMVLLGTVLYSLSPGPAPLPSAHRRKPSISSLELKKRDIELEIHTNGFDHQDNSKDRGLDTGTTSALSWKTADEEDGQELKRTHRGKGE